MSKFVIPVEWAMMGLVEVEADSIEEAIQKFDEHIDEIELPKWNEEYIDGSFTRSSVGNQSADILYYSQMQEYWKL